MPDSSVEASPQRYARIGGLLYLIIIVVGLFGEAFVRDRLIVSSNAAATAANILAHESLWRFHIAAEMFLLICAIALLWILFLLLRPVSRDLALLAVLFNLVSIGIEAAVTMYLLQMLLPLGTAGYLKAFTPEQLYALASMSARSHAYGFGVSLIFFGCFCVVIGRLIFRSGYFPKVVGILMQVTGVCYLTNSFALMLAPSFANRVFVLVMPVAFVGEASLCLWLLLKGVNVDKWQQRASAGHAGATRYSAT